MAGNQDKPSPTFTIKLAEVSIAPLLFFERMAVPDHYIDKQKEVQAEVLTGYPDLRCGKINVKLSDEI